MSNIRYEKQIEFISYILIAYLTHILKLMYTTILTTLHLLSYNC